MAMPRRGFNGVDPNIDVLPNQHLLSLNVHEPSIGEQLLKFMLQKHVIQKWLFLLEDPEHPWGVYGGEGNDLTESETSREDS